jgi:hypothetical protein
MMKSWCSFSYVENAYRFVHGTCDPEADPSAYLARKEVDADYEYKCFACKAAHAYPFPKGLISPRGKCFFSSHELFKHYILNIEANSQMIRFATRAPWRRDGQFPRLLAVNWRRRFVNVRNGDRLL